MPDATNQPISTVSDLRSAFGASAEPPKQEETSTSQEQGKVEEPKTPTSREEPGTSSSRTGEPKSKEELLSELSLEDIKSHPTLGRAWQSSVDSGVAASVRGKSQEIEQKVRDEYSLRAAEARFSEMDEAELGAVLKADPEARRLWTMLQSRPTPAAQAAELERQAGINYLTKTIQFYDKKINSTGLPQEARDKLDPKNYLSRPGTADEILEAWANDVDKAVNEFQIAKELAKSNKTEEESSTLSAQAQADKGKRSPVLTNGTKTAPPLDIMQGTGRQALSEAFARKA